ncbi:MAG: HesA/MoeB/ThiF family protein [Eggerthellaceae bacterium]|nr:HesA/MoeB/ThiF family protein [Eggerthellaceae bacterium]
MPDETDVTITEPAPGAPVPLFEETPFSRNIPTISAADQERLAASRVLVVGCGGLGGYAVEFLVRLGVGHIRVVDPDTFAESNLNRQVLATRATLGRAKAECARERALAINPEVDVEPVVGFFTPENAAGLLAGCDVAVDALDNPVSRVDLERACAEAGVPLVHGAVRGRFVQAATVLPGEGTLGRLYGAAKMPGADNPGALRTLKSCLSLTPPLAMALEVSELLNLLLGRPRGIGAGKILLFDAATMRLTTVEL